MTTKLLLTVMLLGCGSVDQRTIPEPPPIVASGGFSGEPMAIGGAGSTAGGVAGSMVEAAGSGGVGGELATAGTGGVGGMSAGAGGVGGSGGQGGAPAGGMSGAPSGGCPSFECITQEGCQADGLVRVNGPVMWVPVNSGPKKCFYSQQVCYPTGTDPACVPSACWYQTPTTCLP